jgi:transcriptional regulator with XRE-family HTH domain
LPQRLEFLIPPPAPPEEAVAEPASEKFVNQETVENIGQRIRQLRESRAMTQSQLQSRSKVSRSYLSRIESGQMTPSLGTLEKISEALNVGLNRFFIPESDGEALLEDPFIQGLRPFLRQLDWEQWQSILKRLQAISDHVHAAPITLRRSPRRRMATATDTSEPGIRMGWRTRWLMVTRRAMRCGVRADRSKGRASRGFSGRSRGKNFPEQGTN